MAFEQGVCDSLAAASRAIQMALEAYTDSNDEQAVNMLRDARSEINAAISIINKVEVEGSAMIYKWRDGRRKPQTFEGFCSAALCANKPPTAKFAAVVFMEGEADHWWLENDQLALEELKRFYRMIDGIDNVNVLLLEPRE